MGPSVLDRESLDKMISQSVWPNGKRGCNSWQLSSWGLDFLRGIGLLQILAAGSE
jgi:hypothetical protein